MHYLKTLVPTLALVASIDALAIRNEKAKDKEMSKSGAGSECTCANSQPAEVQMGVTEMKMGDAGVQEAGADAQNAGSDANAGDAGAAAGGADAGAASAGAADAGAADAGAAGAGAAGAGADAAGAGAADAGAAAAGADAAGADAAGAGAANAGAADAGAANAGAADAGAANAGAAGAGAGAAGADAAAAGAGAQGGARAVYFMTNQNDNAIMMLPVQADGTLGEGTSIPTGGQGAAMIDMMTGEEVATDSLASQSSIRVAGDMMFAVNAGSNSLSMFAINPEDPLQLTMVGQPVETGGDFPTSVAVSSDLSMACVAHNGAAAGVSCATFDAAAGIGEFDGLRPFDLQQTNPPTGPLNGIGMTFFDEQSTMLVTNVKGNPMDPSGNFPGFVSMFSVQDGAVGTEDTQITPTGSAVLFGIALIPGTTNILTTDGSFGAAVLDLANPEQFVGMTELADQSATCWAAVSELTGTGFVTDVGVNRLAEMDTASGALVNDLLSENGNPGMIDLQSAGDKIYALAPGNGTTPCAVTVFDVSGGAGTAQEVQNFPVAAADNRAMGMAFHA